MKKSFLFLVLSICWLLISSFSSCEKKPVEQGKKAIKFLPLTSKLIKDYDITPNKLKRAQYYIGGNVVMKKDVNFKGSEVDSVGQITLKSLEAENQVIVNQNTPGVCNKIDSGNILRITFGADSDFFTFGPGNDEDGTYQIYLLKKDSENNPQIKYGSEILTITTGLETQLLIDPNEVKGEGDKKIEPGRKVGTSKKPTPTKSSPRA